MNDNGFFHLSVLGFPEAYHSYRYTVEKYAICRLKTARNNGISEKQPGIPVYRGEIFKPLIPVLTVYNIPIPGETLVCADFWMNAV